MNSWRDDPKRVAAVEMIDLAHFHEDSARRGKRDGVSVAEHLEHAANCRAQARRIIEAQ